MTEHIHLIASVVRNHDIEAVRTDKPYGHDRGRSKNQPHGFVAKVRHELTRSLPKQQDQGREAGQKEP